MKEADPNGSDGESTYSAATMAETNAEWRDQDGDHNFATNFTA